MSNAISENEIMKLVIEFQIDHENISDYYNLSDRSDRSKKSNHNLNNLYHEAFVSGNDWKIWDLIQIYFKNDNPNNISLLEKVHNDLVSITYLYANLEWTTYYRYLDKSYSPKTSKSQENKFIAIEVEELKELISILKMLDDIDRSDAVFRYRDEFGNVIKDMNLKISRDERLSMLKKLLNTRMKLWELKQLTRADLNIYYKYLNKTLTYSTDHPMIKVTSKMTNITSQGVMYLHQENGLNPEYTVEYLTKLLANIETNWSWDKRASPLNGFNSKVIKTLNKYLEDKSRELGDQFTIGAKKQKEHILFACLRLFNFIPHLDNLDIHKPYDAKEDYIKDLLKK